MFNVNDELENEAIEVVKEKEVINGQESIDIIAKHVLLCAEKLKKAGFKIEDFKY